MAYYAHPDIVWIPISLEEMLRVSGGAGLSQKEGLLSAKNLGFEQRATSDDILLVGIEGPAEQIKIYIHPVEVKIGQNSQGVLNKAKSQVINTYKGLWSALWPEDGKETLERKMSRNFFMQLLIVCCEKLKLYGVYYSMHSMADELRRRRKSALRHFPKWSQKTFFETGLCGQRVRKTMSEGMGSVIPIKVAEGRSFSEKLKMWDTGESCPKKVMAPQICKTSETSPPINPRKNASKATRKMCNMKKLPPFFDPDGSLPPDFSGVSGRRYVFYGREKIIYGKGIAGDSPGQQAGGL